MRITETKAGMGPDSNQLTIRMSERSFVRMQTLLMRSRHAVQRALAKRLEPTDGLEVLAEDLTTELHALFSAWEKRQ